MLGFTTFLLPILPAPSEKTSPILLFSIYSQHPFPEKVRGPLSTSAMTPTFLPSSSAPPFQASYGEVSDVASKSNRAQFQVSSLCDAIPWRASPKLLLKVRDI